MLFDLRSKGRRRTVRFVYFGLALIMGVGLIGFGVGSGNGFGGLFSSGGAVGSGTGGGGANGQASQEEKQALAQTRANPNNPAGWIALMQARYVSAGQGNNFNSATNTYTASGKAEMASALTAWQRYLQLTNTPDPNMAIVAARAYDAIAQYKNEAAAWQIVTAANPSVPTYYEDLAVAAYQAKNANLGDLAAAKAVDLAPKSNRIQLRSELKTVRTQALGAAAASTPTTTAGTTTTAPSTTTKPTKAKSKTGKKK
jgi:hypothetical protein